MAVKKARKKRLAFMVSVYAQFRGMQVNYFGPNNSTILRAARMASVALYLCTLRKIRYSTTRNCALLIFAPYMQSWRNQGDFCGFLLSSIRAFHASRVWSHDSRHAFQLTRVLFRSTASRAAACTAQASLYFFVASVMLHYRLELCGMQEFIRHQREKIRPPRRLLQLRPCRSGHDGVAPYLPGGSKGSVRACNANNAGLRCFLELCGQCKGSFSWR